MPHHSHYDLIINILHLLEVALIRYSKKTPYGAKELNHQKLTELQEMTAALHRAANQIGGHHG